MRELTNNKKAFITGGSSGVGFEIARRLLTSGIDVCLGVRNTSRGASAFKSLEAIPGKTGNLSSIPLDLADLGSVREAGALMPQCDFMILNAGMIDLGSRQRCVTTDGLEVHFQTNYLGHFALLRNLFPKVLTWNTKVVLQSSRAALFGKIRWNDPQLEKNYSPWAAYAQSKLALALWANELASKGVDVGVSDPGIVPNTGVAPRIRKFVPPILAQSLGESLWNTPRKGAMSAVAGMCWADRGTRLYVPSGWFGISGGPKRRPMPKKFMDLEATRKLVELSNAILNIESGQ